MRCFEPIRSIYAPDGWIPHACLKPLGGWLVHYGESYWPSYSYWLVPGTED
jgi:hypothetical protein